MGPCHLLGAGRSYEKPLIDGPLLLELKLEIAAFGKPRAKTMGDFRTIMALVRWLRSIWGERHRGVAEFRPFDRKG